MNLMNHPGIIIELGGDIFCIASTDITNFMPPENKKTSANNI